MEELNPTANTLEAQPIDSLGHDYLEHEIAPSTNKAFGIDLNYVDISQNFFINLFLLVAVFFVAKFIFAKFILAKRNLTNIANNEASAFSLGSIIVGLALIFTSSVYGDLSSHWKDATINVLTYCGLGIFLIIISGLIFDKISLAKFNLGKEIKNNNLAAGIVEGANFISSALIIMAILIWAEPVDSEGLKILIVAYFISQFILTITAYVWQSLFSKSKKSSATSFQDEIKNGNVAVAIDFFGKRIATALAINIATTLLAYQSLLSITTLFKEWVLVSIMSIILLQGFAFIASRVIIATDKGNSTSEKISGGCIPTAIISASIYIAFGIILDQILI